MFPVDPLDTSASRVHETVLANGLRLLVRQVRTAPLAAVWCCYGVGSADERDGSTGVSHWVEHMNFKGTTRIPRERIKGLVEQFGGDWNAYTWLDQTCYTDTASSGVLDHLLFIESERMSGSLFDPADCESERTVIIAELQGGENDPELLLDQEVTATALRLHPYRHPTIGWLPDLERLSRAELYDHYRRYYVPNNATLVVVGDVDPADVLTTVHHRFDAIPAREVPRPFRPAEPAQLGERRVVLTREGHASYLRIAYRAPSIHDPQFAPLLVLDAILSGAKGINVWSTFHAPPAQRRSRLYTSLVQGGLAAAVGGGLMPTADPFLYIVSATATDGTPLDRLEARLLVEIERVRREGVRDDDVERAKRQLRARMVFEADSVTSLAHEIGFFQTLGEWRLGDVLRQRVANVTAEDCAAVADAVLRAEGRTVGWYQPQERA